VKHKILDRLIKAFNSLPGIGPKMAERLAYYIVHTNNEEATELADAIREIKSKIILCKQCFAPSENEICSICYDDRRDHTTICITENIEGLIAIEKTKKYNGIYYILGGSISPLEGITTKDLKLDKLMNYTNGAKEIIIATNPNTDGDITANYIAKMIRPKNIKVTRLAYGLPMGGSLEYADEITLTRSLESRKEL